MRRPSTLRNAVFTLGGQLGARLFALLLYAILARSLGHEFYGDIGVGTAFGVLASVLLEPGMNALIIRDGAQDPATLVERAGDSLGYKLGLLLPVWLLTGSIGWLLGYRGSTLQAIWLCGITQLLVVLEDLSSSVLIARERNDLEGQLRVTSKLLFTVAGLGSLALGASFPVLLGAMASAQAVTGAVGLFLVRRSGVRLSLRPAPARMLNLLRRGWPLAIAGVLWQITVRLDQVLASQLGVPRGDLGDYNAAVKLVEALILFPNAIVTTFSPILARAWLEGKERAAVELQLALQAAFAVTLPIVLGGAVLAGDITHLVYSDRFPGAGPLLATQLVALLGVAVQFSTFSTLVAAGSLRMQSLIVGANLLANVVANLVLVPRLGVQGASLAAVVSAITATLACALTLHRLGVRPRYLASAWRPLVSALVMAGVAHAVRDRAGFAPALLAGAVIYLALFAALDGGATLTALRARRAASADPSGSSPKAANDDEPRRRSG